MTNRLFIVLLIVVGFGLFFLKGYVSLDPDLGWHLRLGQYEITHGIPKTDPFSYTMPHYPFIDHEWLTNILMQLLYQKIGIAGLAIIFAALTFLALWVSLLNIAKRNYLIIICIAAVSLLGFAGVRPQVLSWLFFSLLIYLLYKKKWLLQLAIIPLLILFWTNMHGSYPLGIATVAIFLVTKSIEEKRVTKKDVLLLLFSIGVTLINPYGLRLWFEPLTQASDISLHWKINEWMPIIMTANFATIIYIPLSAILCFFVRKKVELFMLVIAVLLFFAGISTTRHFPFYIIFTLPYVVLAIKYLQDVAKKVKYGEKRFLQAYKICTVIFSIILVLQSILTIKQMYAFSEKTMYPKGAMLYLQKGHYHGNIFTRYEWGGYTIWKLTNTRIFIDGRMPSWRWTPPDSSESASAMDEYLQLDDKKLKVTTLINKYHIDTFVLNKDGQEQHDYIYTSLIAAQWKGVYEDKVSIIFQRSDK